MTSDASDSDGFLSRWSRRKAQVRQGQPLAEDAARTEPAIPGPAAAVTSSADATAAAAATVAAAESPSAAAAEPVKPRPTLADVERLDAGSDYREFVARDVDPEVRNAAFKKLFHSEPQFNVMDGLDVYIDDYNTPMPLSATVMKTLVQARALGLIDDELEEQDLPAPDPVPMGRPAAEPMPQSEGPSNEPAPSDSAVALENGSDDPVAEGPTTPEALREAETIATAAGTVVPFPVRPGRADPA